MAEDKLARPTDLWPGPPPGSPATLSIARLRLPIHRQPSLPEGAVAQGRLVTVTVVSPDEATFSLRHIWISADLGLPGAGIPIYGGIRIREGRGLVSVFTSRSGTVFVATLGLVVAVGMIIVALREPDWWNVLIAGICLLMIVAAWRSYGTAAQRVAADAIEVLDTLGQRGVEQCVEADKAPSRRHNGE